MQSGTAAAHEGLTLARVERLLPEGAVDVRLDADGRALRCQPLHASAVPPVPLAVGDAVLVWTAGPRAPGAGATGVVMGRVGPSRADADDAADATAPTTAAALPDELVLEAREQLTLRVGDGSITIRADGRILIKGTDLVSHARRQNRIRGGSVSIN